MIASILIPTYNRADSLERALNSIVQVDFPRDQFEIVVVDNNSTDATPEVAAKFAAQGVRVVREPRLSFTVARHTAADAARGELLIYVDDDVTVEPQWLRAIVEAFEADEKVGMVAGPIFGVYEQTPPDWVKQQDPIMLSLYERTDAHEPPACLGPNLSVRKSLLREVGGFPPDTVGVESHGKANTVEKLYVGIGDSGLSYSVKHAGYRIAFAPRAVAYHHIPPVRLTKAWWHSRYAGEGCCLAISQQHAEPVSKTTLWLRGAKCALKAAIRPIRTGKNPEHNEFMRTFERSQSRVWFALAQHPDLANQLWDISLSGVQPSNEADAERLVRLGRAIRV